MGSARLGVAVSGGPDSLALLLLAHAALGELIEAATVDHGLRPESATEAAFVASLCDELGVPHTTLKVDVAEGNMQHEARRARYAALGEWLESRSLAAVMTAHHADDQAETLLMRLNRGSGLSGLRGIRALASIQGRETQLLRPLLGWRKAELEQIVRDCGIEPVRDPSNEDLRFDRARMRKALTDADWLDVEAIARSATLLEEAEAALLHAAQQEWAVRVKPSSGEIRYARVPGTPREVQLRIVERAIAELGGAPRLSQVSDLVDLLEKGERSNLAGVLARVDGSDWVFSPEPPRRS